MRWRYDLEEVRFGQHPFRYHVELKRTFPLLSCHSAVYDGRKMEKKAVNFGSNVKTKPNTKSSVWTFFGVQKDRKSLADLETNKATHQGWAKSNCVLLTH